MNMTIEIVIVAVVILIVALVVLTIFGIGIKPATSISDAENICKQQAAAACAIIRDGEMPATVLEFKVPVTISGKQTTASCNPDYLKWKNCAGGKPVA